MPTRSLCPAPGSVSADDGWAILADPPGIRDLAEVEYWSASLERSLRRRNARRPPIIVARGRAPISIALSAVALGGPAAAVAGAHGASAAKTAPSMALGRGANGPRVRALQRALGIPADGRFGARTERAVRAFQRAHGIPATGYVGPLTTAALGLLGASPGPAAPSAQTPSAVPVPLTADAVRAMQQALGVQADGIIGPQTRGALRRFQAAHGLPVSGQPDAATLGALGTGSTPADSGAGATPTGATPTTPVSQTTPSSPAQAAVAAAMSKVGSPYRYAGNGPDAFDCSGLVSWAMRQAGVSVPRTSFAQYGMGTAVPSNAIQAGDLVFFNTAGPGASDVGIATGPTTAVSATTHGVMTHSITSGYWGSHFVGARRVV